MRHRFTIVELKGMTDNEILQQLCRERQTDCTNINSPLSRKLSQMIKRLDIKIEEDDKAEMQKECMNKHVEICSHNVSYYVNDDEFDAVDLDMDETGIEHITKLIVEGYIEGDLTITDPDTHITFHGYWHIERSK